MRLSPLIAAGLLLGGCGPGPQASQKAQEAAEEKQKAEKKIIEEQQGRQQAEARLRAQEERTSRWQFATVLAISATSFALIIGCILGSSARHEADQ